MQWTFIYFSLYKSWQETTPALHTIKKTFLWILNCLSFVYCLSWYCLCLLRTWNIWLHSHSLLMWRLWVVFCLYVSNLVTCAIMRQTLTSYLTAHLLSHGMCWVTCDMPWQINSWHVTNIGMSSDSSLALMTCSRWQTLTSHLTAHLLSHDMCRTLTSRLTAPHDMWRTLTSYLTAHLLSWHVLCDTACDKHWKVIWQLTCCFMPCILWHGMQQTSTSHLTAHLLSRDIRLHSYSFCFYSFHFIQTAMHSQL